MSDNKYYVKFKKHPETLHALNGCGFQPHRPTWRTDLTARLEAVPFQSATKTSKQQVPRLRRSFASRTDLFFARDDSFILAMTMSRLTQSHFLYGHCACVNSAPSIQMVCPLMKAASLLARKATVGAMSAAVPTLPSGVSRDHVLA